MKRTLTVLLATVIMTGLASCMRREETRLENDASRAAQEIADWSVPMR